MLLQPRNHAGASLHEERARATALTEERNRLEAALQAASGQAQAAEAQAAAARAEAEASAAQAAKAAQQAQHAQEQLAEVQEERQAVQAQLESVSVVVEQQQEALKAKEVQVGQLQKVVVDTRESFLLAMVSAPQHSTAQHTAATTHTSGSSCLV